MGDEARREPGIAVELSGVSKSYTLYKNDRERFLALFHRGKGLKTHAALKDVSFSIRQGEAVGVIGKNGAGKSTLLKIITGVTFPTEGEVRVQGRVGALLELTAGFAPEMTGRENIYLKGCILGLSREQVEALERDIVDFAELGEYIDQPVRTYSSGMKMRLGFAINVSTQPDILVVDEALSVGDAAFREKCNRKILDLVGSGVTVLYVSHAMKSVQALCSRVLYLVKGKLVFDGDVETALEKYQKGK